LRALLPGMEAPSVKPGAPAQPAAPGGPDAEVAELQARATACPRCGKPRRALRVKKEGPNHGRLFLACSDRKCDSFEWAGPRQTAAAAGATAPAGQQAAAPAPADPYEEVLRRLRELNRTCLNCGTERPVIARATRPGPNQGRFYMKCNECEKFDWLTDEEGDFVEPDIE